MLPTRAAVRRVLVVLLLCAICDANKLTPKRRYELKCQEMVQSSQAAAEAHNKGDTALAEKHLAGVHAAFAEAIELFPDEPQAYANYATFHLNTHKFDEALVYFEETRKRLGDVDPSMAAFFDERVRFTKLGKVSKQRDDIYQEGQGNITEARLLVLEQLEMSRSPEFYFDLATMEVMLAEVNASRLNDAIEHFGMAQEAAFQAFVDTRRLLSQGANACGEDSGLVRDWTTAKEVGLDVVEPLDGVFNYGRVVTVQNCPNATQLDLRFTERQVYIAKFKKVGISGNDGLIIDRMAPACNIYIPSSQGYLHLAKNMQMLATWSGSTKPSWHDHFRGRFPYNGASRQAQPAKKVASIIQYTTGSYYHWLLEAIGRLLLLQPLLENSPSLKVVLPRDATANKFITNYLALLPFQIDPKRIIQYDINANNDFRLDVGTLYFPDWQTPSAAFPVHCLPPRSVLRRIRSAFVPNPPAARTKVVYTTRKADRMRKVSSEPELIAALQAAVQGTPYEVVVFDGQSFTASATVQLFSEAVAVVGAHGGALSNIVFCSPGALLVEIGFRSPATRHYAHAAMALDLEYELLHLSTDERSVGSASVDVVDGTADVVRTLVADHLAQISKSQLSKDEL